uniref:DUF2293 domain-containing protein n=1 Tax=Photinus pyralis TaxID=7054 RepID=A0A1Y1LKZ4_PHOPY
MGREKRKVKPPIRASGPKERRRRNQKFLSDHPAPAPAPQGLVAKPTLPKSRHHTYFEFVENIDKKDKILQVKETKDKIPPPGYEFVPIGNPRLTKACKDLSREKDILIFVVSPVTTSSLSQQINRLGHHIREAIVEEAKATIADLPESGAATPDGNPEPIPEAPAEYHAQADAALIDLFPRIPNFDREVIIQHAFTRRANTKGELPVGFSGDIPLARRVQLAVLAHIRHNHTRYDELLKEAGWRAARKAVETLCLDILVKWRGDEETGRDQLDEILREVVVISDSEDDSSDEETLDYSSIDGDGDGSPSSVLISTKPTTATVLPQMAAVEQPGSPGPTTLTEGRTARAQAKAPARPMDHVQKTDRKNQRGFKRYHAAWQEAILRNRGADDDRSGFIAGGVGEYNPRHPQMPARQLEAHQSTTYDGSQVERAAPSIGFTVSSGLPPMESQSYTRPVATLPLYANQRTEIQASRDALSSSVYEFSGESPSSLRMMSPITKRLGDMAVPSIEPASSETVMQPAFVRAVPPRQQDHLDPLSSQPPLFHTIRSMSPMDSDIRNSPDRGDRRIISDYPGERGFQTSSFALDAPTYVPQERIDYSFIPGPSHARPALQGWSRPYEHPIWANPPRGDRIIVNASRPGTRTNPILMEDRGGFFERVALPLEPRVFAHQKEDSPTLHSEPYRATGSYLVSSETDARILRNDRGNDCIEVMPMNRPGGLHNSHHSERFYGHQPRLHQSSVPEESDIRDVESRDRAGHYVAGRYWPAQEVRRYPQMDAPLQNHQPSYRSHHGKRPAVDDHYQNASRGRRRVRPSDDVIVLE